MGDNEHRDNVSHCFDPQITPSHVNGHVSVHEPDKSDRGIIKHKESGESREGKVERA